MKSIKTMLVGRYRGGVAVAGRCRSGQMPRLLVTLILGAAVFTGMARAAEQPESASPPRERAKAPYFQKLANQTLLPYLPHSAHCLAVLEDLRAMRGFSFIEPILRTSSYDDPRLMKYRNQCPALALNKIVADPTEWEDRPEEEQDAAKMAFYASRDFALYLVDIDNNLNTGNEIGEEYIFTGEHACARRDGDDCYGFAYFAVDLKKCTKGEIIGTLQRYKFDKEIHSSEETAVVQYKSNNYIMQGSTGDSPYPNGKIQAHILLRTYIPKELLEKTQPFENAASSDQSILPQGASDDEACLFDFEEPDSLGPRLGDKQ